MYPESCPEFDDLRDSANPRKSFYRYAFDLSVENVNEFFSPIIAAAQEAYAKHLLRRALGEMALTGVVQLGLSLFGPLRVIRGFHGRSLNVATHDFFISGIRNVIRIIFDSGASTNLVFKPLAGDPVVGPRDLNLAAGEKSSGYITASGEVQLPNSLVGKCTEELISMGRFCLYCGHVIWKGRSCDLYIVDEYGHDKLLYRLPVENNCPMMSEDQAQHVRELQRAALSWGKQFSAPQGEDELQWDFSPSLALLDVTDAEFDAAYQQGSFKGYNFLFDNVSLLPQQLNSIWIENKRDSTTFLGHIAGIYQSELSGVQQSISDTAQPAHFSFSGDREGTSVPMNVGGSQQFTPECNPAVIDQTVRSSETEGSKPAESDQLDFELLRRSEVPMELEFSRAKIGVNPNAMKAPQGKTSLKDKLKFYKSTKGAWVIWGDIHSASRTGFDGSTAVWVYHCSRLKAKNPKKPLIEEIETCELNFPFRENTGQTACAGLRHCLECLGIWTDDGKKKVNFYFESEEESTLDTKLVEEYILACHGHHHFSVPYRHPAKEFAVKNLLFKVRKQLEFSKMPAVAWPAVARTINEVNALEIKDRPYRNKTFNNGFKLEMVGRYVKAFVPGHKEMDGVKQRSVESKQIPALLLNPAPRNRVYIIHTTDKDLGYRCTSVPWSQVTFPEDQEWVFENEPLDNLRLLKYMKAPFKSKLLSKKIGERPKKLTCPRCIKLHNNGSAQDKEQGNDVKGHKCDSGCNYFCYDCFSDLQFADDAQFQSLCPLAECVHRILHFEQVDKEADVHKSISDTALPTSVRSFLDDPESSIRGNFDRPVATGEKGNLKDFAWFRELNAYFEDPEFRSQVFNWPDITSEESATMLYLARDYIFASMLKTWEKEADLCRRNNHSEEEYFGAIVVKNKDVLKECQTNPEAVLQWLASNNKELENLVNRGVLKIVKMSDIQNLNRDDYEMIPSLVVYSKKTKADGPTTNKSRLVACGNFQLPTDKEAEGLQSGVYAGTTSQLVWRSLLNIFSQGRQSVACMDVSEAFTQTDEKSQGSRHLKTYLRLPSQWKSMLLPTLLKNSGCTIKNYNDFLLQILKSIYGETSAPKRWQETLRRCLEKHGFKACLLEESLYMKIVDGQLTLVSTYVDDLWFFSMNSETLVELMYEISQELRCTAGEMLCGAPVWMFRPESEMSAHLDDQPAAQSSISDTAQRAHQLTDRQREIVNFFKPIYGEPRFGVATKESPLSYVSIDIYFQDDYLVLDQTRYVEKAFAKLLEKKVFQEDEQFAMSSLFPENFNHMNLMEDCKANPLLTKEELTLLRIGVNTLSFYALSVGIGLQAALGQIARGQSAGRKRHLTSLKYLIFYAYQHRHEVLKVHCPSWVQKANVLSEMTIFTQAHVDSSMGFSGPLGTDAHARQGCCIMVGVVRDLEGLVQGKSSLQTTVSLSTCEAELTASSWAAKQILGLRNLFKEVFISSTIDIPRLFGDNRAANLLASNQASMRNHRHLQLPQIWIREQSQQGNIKIFNIDTHVNTSDMLTKVLPHEKLEKLLRLLGYVSNHS